MKKKISSLFCGVATLAMLISAVMFMSFSNKYVQNNVQNIDKYKNRTFNVNDVEFEMVYVEGGTFMMGSDDREAWSWEEPVHQVTLSGYYIGKTEVTQALWQAVMGNNPSHFKFKGANFPVYEVSWNDCQAFIAKLNRLTGENFCLPTEAQWEFAARGGIKSKGYKYSGSNNVKSVAWYGDIEGYDEEDLGRPVAKKRPNELGIYDMSGNVREWCEDWYGEYTSGAVIDPQGPSSGSRRINRGESCITLDSNCRCSSRYSAYPEDTVKGLGLRLALK